jgi:aminoglycoside phosphotransferase (APT) family kinase protein
VSNGIETISSVDGPAVQAEIRASPLDGPYAGTLRAWLETELPGTGPWQFTAITAASASNEMWDVRDSTDGRYALRRPPAVRNAPGAHDVTREARLLSALEHTDVPAPRLIAACADEAVMGAPFYLMSHVDGVVLQDPLPAPYDADPATRHRIGLELVGALARLSDADWRGIGLGDFGRPEGFLDRQVDRWLGQLARYRTRDIPGLDELGAWLRANQPPAQPSGLIHGDYSLFNVLFAPEAPARLVAIVDWETATIGDPLLDLGWVLAQWSEPGEPAVLPTGITHQPGMATRAELVQAYAKRSGRTVDALPYYAALATFKLICIVEGSWYRWISGQSANPKHAQFETLGPDLAQHALAITRGQWL